MAGLVAVIKPLPAPWLGLGGDDFLCLSPMEMSDPFLSGWLSFPSFFLFDDPFLTTLGADVFLFFYESRLTPVLKLSVWLLSFLQRANDESWIKRWKENDGKK